MATVALSTVPCSVAFGQAADTPSPYTVVVKAERYVTTAYIELGVEQPKSCAPAPPGRITVTVRHGRETASATAPDACSTWSETRKRLRHRAWELDLFDGDKPGAAFAELHLRGRRDGERLRFTYAIAWGDRTLQRGTIIGRTVYRPTHQVWEGSDAFINYCINESQRIRSEGGRLYCWAIGLLQRRWKVTPRS
jgi:hypothetical protein